MNKQMTIFQRAAGCLKLAGLITLLVFGAATLRAQNSAALRGTISDANGASVAGAAIVLTETEASRSRTVTANESGAFAFEQLRPGIYRLRVEKSGFRPFEQNNIALLVATPINLKIQLEAGTVSETVIVESDAVSTLNRQDATIGTTFTEREVKELPFLARNPVTALTLQPGVVFTGESDTDLLQQGSNRDLDDREGVINGVRGNQTSVAIDGAQANDFETQSAFTATLPITLDSVKEFRVLTLANATDGFASGAQVYLVTKNGTNDFSGNARYYFRPTGASANSFFNNASGIERPKLDRSIFGGSFGGPILKNRFFFFADYEARRDRSESTETRIVPTESLKQGILRYRATSGAIVALNDVQLAALDPLRLGVNPAMRRYLAQFPAGNDTSVSPDGGLNYTGFRFNAPVNTNNNIYTLRLDYNLTASGTHTFFGRGILGDIKTDLVAAQYPGLDPSSVLLNNSRGAAFGYTGQFGANISNTLRYAFTRQGIENTGTRGETFSLLTINPVFAGADDTGGIARAKSRRVPVNEISDDLVWVKGKHTLQTGVTLLFTRNNRLSEANSFNRFQANAGFCANGCSEVADALLNDGNPNNDPESSTSVTGASLALFGAITQGNATFSVDPQTRRFLPAGAAQIREFAENGTEFYIQDSWQARSNLTITGGVRYSYYTPLWETRGAQVRPTIDITDWFERRKTDMYAGSPSDAQPLLSFDLAGRANGRPAWYAPDRNNFAPRISVAYSPDFGGKIGEILFGENGRSAIRAGFGIYYDRVGGTLAVTTDQYGSPGLSTSLQGAADSLTTAPRFSGACASGGCSGLPAISAFVTPPANAAFPFTPDANVSNIGFVTDTNLKTPYAMKFNLSFQRELPKGFVMDVAYVGTLGRRLLSKIDLAQSTIYLTDPQSGQNLQQAYGQIIDLINRDVPIGSVGNIAFFQNLLPNLPAFYGAPELTPTQAFYQMARDFAPSWADPLYFVIDGVGTSPGNSPWNARIDPQQDGRVLFQPQFSSLPAWFNYGKSNYHSLQLSLRRRFGSVFVGANYVFSKSIDNGSAAENSGFNTGTPFPTNGQIPNAFRPDAHRAVSNFDLRHNLNAHFVYDLPFGKGQKFGGGTRGVVGQIIGGLTVTGIYRFHSGFPLTPDNGFNFPTNFFIQGAATLLRPLSLSVTKRDASGSPNLFSDPQAARAALAPTRFGETGSRNAIRAPRFSTFDFGLNKRIYLPWSEKQNIELRATFFNLFNTVNFSARPGENRFTLSSPANFGRITETVGPRGGAREMEFAVRYSF